MSINNESDWENSEINPKECGEKIFSEEGNGKKNSYDEYLFLLKFLSCQFPLSKCPDERVFITIHQHYELIFKQMIFDIVVVIRTISEFLKAEDNEFYKLSRAKEHKFWGHAITASERILKNCKLLPILMDFLHDENTFSSLEFAKFRDFLSPASGFQSAQFRLIQHAFAKSNALEIKMFPISKERCVKVTDEVILKNYHKINNSEKSISATELDNVIHKALDRIGKNQKQPKYVQEISQDKVNNVIKNYNHFINNFGYQKQDFIEKCCEVFSKDLNLSVKKENEKRNFYSDSYSGACFLSTEPTADLFRILKIIILADDALYGSKNSFLSFHYNTAKKKIMTIAEHNSKVGNKTSYGTGGGGLEYLSFSLNHLIPLFPSSIACRMAAL